MLILFLISTKVCEAASDFFYDSTHILYTLL